MANAIYSDRNEKLITPSGIIYFVHLAQKKDWGDGKTPKYEAKLLFRKDQAKDLKEIAKAAETLSKTAHGGKGPSSPLLKPIEVGEQTFYSLKVKTSKKFGAILPNKTAITGADIHEGNIVRCRISLVAGVNAGNRYISATLLSILKLSEGSGVPEGITDDYSTDPTEDFEVSPDELAAFSLSDSAPFGFSSDDDIPF